MDGDDVDAAPQFYSPLKHQPAIKSIQPNLYSVLQPLPTYIHTYMCAVVYLEGASQGISP